MAQALAARLGLGVGISSGANFIGALWRGRSSERRRRSSRFPDDNKKYLSTALLQPEPRRDHHTPSIELLGFDTPCRSCQACLGQETLGLAGQAFVIDCAKLPVLP